MQKDTNSNKIISFVIVILFLFVIFSVAGKEAEKKRQELENIPLDIPTEPFVSEDEYVPPAPLDDPNFISNIDLGVVKMLELNQKVKLSNYNDTFQITGFENSPCPPGAACIWSGQDVYWEMNVGGKIYKKTEPLQQIPDLPYTIQIVESDYTTYAKVIISKK